jgi:arylsulfatase A-like enzyme
MRWPGKIPAATECPEVCAGFDLFTTFARVAKAKVPADRIIDGKDLWPLMVGTPGAKSPHEAFYYYQGYRLGGVRSGPWTLLFGPGDGKAQDGAPELLFNVLADPAQARDGAADHPDVVRRLRAMADRAREDLGDASRGMTGRNRRPPGRADD